LLVDYVFEIAQQRKPEAIYANVWTANRLGNPRELKVVLERKYPEAANLSQPQDLK
jgi:hypothetical protein